MRNRRVLSWASVAVCFLLVPSALLAGDGHVRHTGHTPIAGQYIIRFEPGQDAASLANRLVTRFGGEIYYVFNGDPILGATIRGISEAIASAISADPSVMDVEQDSQTTLFQVPPGWGLDRIDQRNLPLDGLYVRDCNAGGYVTVYVLDSGISHITSEFGSRVIDGWHKSGTDFSDSLNHGTSVASIIGGANWGVAPGVTLVNVKTASGVNDSVSDLLGGIGFVDGDLSNHVGPKIVNMSVGWRGGDSSWTAQS